MKRQFIWISRAEGISYLLLLLVAMPLKYFADFPEAVKYTGWAHGVLFVAYLLWLIVLWFKERWPFTKAFAGGVAALLPFGPFWFENKYLKESN